MPYPTDRRRLDQLVTATEHRVFPDRDASEVAGLVRLWLDQVWDRSPASGHTHASRLDWWLSWCDQQQVDPLVPSVKQVDDFRLMLQARGQAASSVKACLAHGHNLLEYAFDRGLRDVAWTELNPFSRVTRFVPVSRRGPARADRLGEDEVLAVWEHAGADPVLGGVLSRLLVCLVAGLGLRASEPGRVDVDEVETELGEAARLSVAMKFGNRADRWAPPWVARQLAQYREQVRVEPEPESDGRVPLLVHPRLGRRVTRDDVRAMLQRARSAAGIAARRRVYAHRFREFYRTRAHDHQAAPLDVEWSMGHDTARLTKHYMNPVLSRERDPAWLVVGGLTRRWAELGEHVPPELIGAVQCTCDAGALIVWCGRLGHATVGYAVPREPGTGWAPGLDAALGPPRCPVCGTGWRLPWDLGELADDPDGTRRALVLDQVGQVAARPGLPMVPEQSSVWRWKWLTRAR